MYALICLLFASPLLAQTPPSPSQAVQGVPVANLAVKQIPNMNGGLVTYYSGNRLKDEESQVATNVYFDRDSGVVKRNGQVLFSNISGCTSQIRSMGEYDNPNGTHYLFAVCGNQTYESTGGGFTAIGAHISSTANVYMRPGLGYEWFSDGIDYLWYTDGVNVSSYTSAPLAKLEGIFQDRVVLGNVSGGASTLYLSGYNNGGDYTLPAVIVDTSAVIFGLNGLNDGRNVTCISDGYRDVLILWNKDEMYGLYGSGYSTFILRKLADIGCDEQETVQEFDGRLKWLSSYGVYEYDGANLRRISDPIKDQVQNIIVTEPGSLSLTMDQYSDWQAGNLCASGSKACMNDILSTDNVVPSTWSVTDNFSNGTFVNASSTTVPGEITPNGAFAGSGFENNFEIGALGGSTAWLNPGGVGSGNPWLAFPNNSWGNFGTSCALSEFGVRFAVDANCTSSIKITVNILDGTTSSIIASKTISGGTAGACSANFIDTSALGNSTFKIQVIGPKGGSSDILLSQSFPRVNEVEFTTALTNTPVGGCNPGTSGNMEVVDFPEPLYIASSTYTSPWFDTTFSTPTPGPFAFTDYIPSDGSGTINFAIRQANNLGGPYGPWVAITSGSIPSISNEFLQYESSFTTIHSNESPPSISNVSLSAETTGYFIANCFPTSPNAAWGLIQSNNVPGNGSLTYSVQGGASCGAATNPSGSWTSQTLNQNIGISTAAYLGVRVLFNDPYFTPGDQPTLEDITVNWQSAAGRPRSASQVFDNRYWLAYSTSTSGTAYNNNVLIYDSLGHWSKFTGINAASLTTYNRQLYAGSSLGDGNVVIENQGNTDLGLPILFDYRSPDYEISAFMPVDLYDLNLEFAAVPAGYSPNVQIQYYVDNSALGYSLGTVPLIVGTKGLIYSTQRIADNGNPLRGHTFGFEVTDDTTTPLTLYGAMIRFTPEEGP